GNALSLERLGSAYAAAGELGKAEVQLEAALKIDPSKTSTLAMLSNVELRRGGPDKAIQQVRQYLENSPSAGAYEILGQLYAAQKNFTAAEESFRKSITMDRNRLAPYGLLAQLYISQKSPQRAIQELENALKINAKSVDAHIVLGLIY